MLSCMLSLFSIYFCLIIFFFERLFKQQLNLTTHLYVQYHKIDVKNQATNFAHHSQQTAK